MDKLKALNTYIETTKREILEGKNISPHTISEKILSIWGVKEPPVPIIEILKALGFRIFEQEYKEEDMSEEALQVIQCIREQGGRYGINVVTGTLMGADTAKLREYNVSRFASYGGLRKLQETEIKKLIQKLLQDGVLHQTADK